MGKLTDNVRGTANKTAGALKDGVGAATGNRKLQAEGKAQKIKGEAQKVSAKVKGALGDDI